MSFCLTTFQVRKIFGPGQGGSAPLLFAWNQRSALVDTPDSKAHDLGSICIVRIKRRAAVPAERLRPPRAAVADLDVNRRRSEQKSKRPSSCGDRHTIRRSGQLLAIGAMADGRCPGIDGGFIANCAAVAARMNTHESRAGHRCGVSRSLFRIHIVLQRTLSQPRHSSCALPRRQRLRHEPGACQPMLMFCRRATQ